MTTQTTDQKSTPALGVVRQIGRDPVLVEDAVQLLRDVISRIESGDVFAVGIVCLHADQSVGTAWSVGAETQIHKFVGGVETLKFRALQALMEWDD